MLKLTSQCVHLGLAVLTLAGVSACSTSAMKGSSGNSSETNAAALSSGSGGSTDGSAVATASGTTGDAGSIFSGNSFSTLSPQDLATPGCSIPQTIDALKKALAAAGSGSGSGWGSGSGSGWGAGKAGIAGWGVGKGGGWGAGKGSDCTAANGAGTGGSTEPLPNGAKLWGGEASAKVCNGSGSGGFDVSMCQWAQTAKSSDKAGYVITLTTAAGAKFAQPFGTAADADTKTACDGAAAQIAKLLGGAATCAPLPVK